MSLSQVIDYYTSLDMTDEEKRALQPPTIEKPAERKSKHVRVLVTDHTMGRTFFIVAGNTQRLRRALRYYRQLDRALIESTLASIVVVDMGVERWARDKALQCCACKRLARIDPLDETNRRCAKCHDSTAFQPFVPKTKKAQVAPVVSHPAEQSLMDRLRAKRGTSIATAMKPRG